MNKKLVLFSILTVIAVGGIFAQEKYDGSKKNTIYFGPVMAGYERALNQSFSVGAEVGINFFGICLATETGLVMAPYFADVFARWYPWQRIFFVNMKLGYQGGDIGDAGVFHINPQIGWKIDIGKAGGWIFETRAGFGLTVGGDAGVYTFTVPILFGRTF
jgi:hypothetical protein